MNLVNAYQKLFIGLQMHIEKELSDNELLSIGQRLHFWKLSKILIYVQILSFFNEDKHVKFKNQSEEISKMHETLYSPKIKVDGLI